MSNAAFGPEVIGEQPILDQEKPAPEGDDLQIHKLSRNPTVNKCEVHYRGHDVPFLAVYEVPVDENGEQVYPMANEGGEDGWIEHDKPYTVRPHDGAYRWDLVIDRRFSYSFETEDELRKVLPIVADAMAVAAGFTSHGSELMTNAHGPAY